MITDTKHIAYRFLAQFVVLLVIYGAVSLLAAAQFLPGDPLAQSTPYHQISAFASVLLHLALVSGFIGGGVYIASTESADGSLRDKRLLTSAFWLWSLVIMGAFLGGLLGLLEGRAGLELPALLDIGQAVVLALTLYAIWKTPLAWPPVLLAWMTGMALLVLCTAAGLIPTDDYVLDRLLRMLSVNARLNVAYVVSAVALGFWLLTRFSNAPQMWANEGLYTTAGLLAVAGALASLAPLYPLGGSEALGSAAVFIIPLAYGIYLAHSYRGLSDRNPTRTLAAHWFGLAILLLFLSVGVLGALQSLPGVAQWTLGTRLTDLQSTLTALGAAAMLLGVVNQASAELRGQNMRITGLLPFWMVAFGVLGGGAALGAAGVTQVYLERIVTFGYLETQMLLTPLYALWIAATLLMALGLLVYLLGFWARRPAVKVDS